jgi:mannitol/fructose-specific phosphotransferase system IIA component (Ntr-type)
MFVTPERAYCVKFAEFICREAIQVDIQAEGKEAALAGIVSSLQAAGRLAEDDVDAILTALLEREKLGSTGIGRGIAIPHAKYPGVSDFQGAIAISKEGIDFDSLDGDKVHVLFLLISPPERAAEHLKALQIVASRLRDNMFLRFLKQAKSPEDVIILLDEADEDAA